MRIWSRRGEGIERSVRRREGLVAVAVDKDKSSQRALKWAIEHYIPRGRCINLVHVKQKPPSSGNDDVSMEVQSHNQTTEMLRPLRCFCVRRQVQSNIVILDDQDVAKALIEYVHQNGVATLLLGATSKNSLARLFKGADIPSSVMKWAPDFCNVFIISKGKLASVRSASRPVPTPISTSPTTERHQNLHDDQEPYVMTLSREEDRLYDELARLESDISFASSSSGKPGSDGTYLSFYESLGGSLHGRDSSVRLKTGSSRSRNPESLHSRSPNRDFSGGLEFSSQDYLERASSSSSQDTDETDDEMRRLKIELKHTMDMYHAACKEALTAKQKTIELEKWKKQEEQRLAEVKLLAKESASVFMESEKAKHKAAMDTVEATKKIVELEVQKRVEAELKALKEAEEGRKVLDALGQSRVALKYQSLLHIFAVLFLFYFYFSVLIA